MCERAKVSSSSKKGSSFKQQEGKTCVQGRLYTRVIAFLWANMIINLKLAFEVRQKHDSGLQTPGPSPGGLTAVSSSSSSSLVSDSLLRSCQLHSHFSLRCPHLSATLAVGRRLTLHLSSLLLSRELVILMRASQ